MASPFKQRQIAEVWMAEVWMGCLFILWQQSKFGRFVSQVSSTNDKMQYTVIRSYKVVLKRSFNRAEKFWLPNFEHCGSIFFFFLSMSNLDGVDNLIDLKRDPYVFLPFFEPSYPFSCPFSTFEFPLLLSPFRLRGPGVAASRLISTNETKASLLRKRGNDGDLNRRPLAPWVVSNPTRPQRPNLLCFIYWSYLLWSAYTNKYLCSQAGNHPDFYAGNRKRNKRSFCFRPHWSVL